MATIQVRKNGGQRYWYLIESRRVNGKPRPIVLAYLGKAEDLLKRLQGLTDDLRLKSYSHGAVAATLNMAHQLDICNIINEHVDCKRKQVSSKPIRNDLTVGATLLLAAIGRICMPTSKRGWWDWAKTTSLEYLLKCNLSKLDSQHFWDMMDSIPVEAIEKIEEKILKKVIELQPLEEENLFYDTTNFFTYINTTNEQCALARRGKNKQKRADLKQVGFALVVTQQDKIPLFHLTYEGNTHDSKVFSIIIGKLKNRMNQLNLQKNDHTLVFDRGNNSRKNLSLIKESDFHYVAALTPSNHKLLTNEALDYFESLDCDKEKGMYRKKCVIWGEERTIIMYVSEKLKTGQIRGIQELLNRKEKKLKLLQSVLNSPRKKRHDRTLLEAKIINLLKGQHIRQLIQWNLVDKAEATENKKYQLDFTINENYLEEVNKKCGLRILMTDRDNWSNEKIIQAYEGQANVEWAFKNMKNPYHLTFKPQFHWTDQKIFVHYFVCVIGYLLSTLLWRQAKSHMPFSGSLDTFLDKLNNIRLGTVLEQGLKPKKGIKAIYQLEEMEGDEKNLMQSLDAMNLHLQRPQLNGFGVYN